MMVMMVGTDDKDHNGDYDGDDNIDHGGVDGWY